MLSLKYYNSKMDVMLSAKLLDFKNGCCVVQFNNFNTIMRVKNRLQDNTLQQEDNVLLRNLKWDPKSKMLYSERWPAL